MGPGISLGILIPPIPLLFELDPEDIHNCVKRSLRISNFELTFLSPVVAGLSTNQFILIFIRAFLSSMARILADNTDFGTT